ncbi:MAG: RNA-binding protein [Dehalococcoidales bacterium]|nr:RNA-binding protein [Dehalococcoidales bacterium]
MRRQLMDSPRRSNRINLYVGNLALTVTEFELKRVFSAFGQVIDVSIMNDEYIGSGQSRRYAYIKMEERTQGEAAILNLNGKSLGDRVIGVIEALPLSPANDTPSCNKYRHRS